MFGPPIRPAPVPKPDVAEEVRPGIYRFRGKLQTAIPTRGPQYAPAPPPVAPPFADTITGDDLANAAGLP